MESTRQIMSKFYVFLLLVAFFSVPVASAQLESLVPAEYGVQNILVLAVTPQNPKPFDSITVEVKSTFTDLGRATIAWVENGELMRSGVGQNRYVTTVGAEGTATEITVIVRAEDGFVHEGRITLRPASLDVFWEANSSVPPFYKGKGHYTRLTSLKVAAIPSITKENGERVKPGELYYTWRRDGTVLGDRSGYGRYTITLDEPIYRTPFVISVTAATADNSYIADGLVSIDAASPKVLVYENNPLYGILFNRSIDREFTLSGIEATLEAYPYFFDVRDRTALSYQWSVGGQNAQGFQGPHVVLRNVTTESGSTPVYLEVMNERKFFEGAAVGFNVQFGQSR